MRCLTITITIIYSIKQITSLVNIIVKFPGVLNLCIQLALSGRLNITFESHQHSSKLCS